MAKAERRAAALAVLAVLTLAGRASGNDEIAPTEHTQPTIVLHVMNYVAISPEIIAAAKTRVAGVYQVIGVRTVWDEGGFVVAGLRDGKLHLNVLLLSQDMREKKNSKDGTRADLLGQAHVPSGRAYIFFDRIAAMPGAATSLANQLGDVIAHEVGHLALREIGHSASGIMRKSLGDRPMYLQSFNRAEARTIRATLMASK